MSQKSRAIFEYDRTSDMGLQWHWLETLHSTGAEGVFIQVVLTEVAISLNAPVNYTAPAEITQLGTE